MLGPRYHLPILSALKYNNNLHSFSQVDRQSQFIQGYRVLYRQTSGLPSPGPWQTQDVKVPSERSVVLSSLKKGIVYEIKVRPYFNEFQGMDSESRTARTTEEGMKKKKSICSLCQEQYDIVSPQQCGMTGDPVGCFMFVITSQAPLPLPLRVKGNTCECIRASACLRPSDLPAVLFFLFMISGVSAKLLLIHHPAATGLSCDWTTAHTSSCEDDLSPRA